MRHGKEQGTEEFQVEATRDLPARMPEAPWSITTAVLSRSAMKIVVECTHDACDTGSPSGQRSCPE